MANTTPAAWPPMPGEAGLLSANLRQSNPPLLPRGLRLPGSERGASGRALLCEVTRDLAPGCAPS